MSWISQWFNRSSDDDASVYKQVGGESVVKAIANSFYNIMEQDPYARDLLAIHPKPLNNIRSVFSDYLTMWMGGPDHYTPARGHPRLRARHLPFAVTPVLKEQWIYCMKKAMYQHVQDLMLANSILKELDALADHMVNT